MKLAALGGNERNLRGSRTGTAHLRGAGLMSPDMLTGLEALSAQVGERARDRRGKLRPKMVWRSLTPENDTDPCMKEGAFLRALMLGLGWGRLAPPAPLLSLVVFRG